VKEAIMRFPIGIIPLGSQNQSAKRLLNYKSEYSEPKFIAEATMAIVRHRVQPQDVMEIMITEEKVEDQI